MEQTVSGEWISLSETQINELWNIYYTTQDFSNTLALGILQEIGAADFEPEPRVPIQFRSLEQRHNKTDDKLPLLGVWPNPASGSAWLHYPVEADDHATFELYSPQGQLLQSFKPNNNGLVELDIRQHSSGIYLIRLLAFNRVVDQIKLTVINEN